MIAIMFKLNATSMLLARPSTGCSPYQLIVKIGSEVADCINFRKGGRGEDGWRLLDSEQC